MEAENLMPSDAPGRLLGKSAFAVDLSHCEDYLRAMHLTPVCDEHVKTVLLDQVHRDRLEGEWAEHAGILDRICTVSSEGELFMRLGNYLEAVWINCVTHSGVTLYDWPFAQSALCTGRIVGVARANPIGDIYGGLTLYRWQARPPASGNRGHAIARFQEGRVVAQVWPPLAQDQELIYDIA